jgi:hypothetical protein
MAKEKEFTRLRDQLTAGRYHEPACACAAHRA